MGGSRAASQVAWLCHSRGLSVSGKKLGSIRAGGRGLLLGRLVVASFLEWGEDMCESTEIRTEIPPCSSPVWMNAPRGGEAAAGVGWMMGAMLGCPSPSAMRRSPHLH